MKGARKIEYEVYLHFIGETEREFLARYPDYPKNDKHPPIVLGSEMRRMT